MSVENRTSDSVSKGVFVYKGTKSFPKPDVFISLSAKQDGDLGRVTRMQMYDELWSEVSVRIESLQSSLNDKVFGDLLSYIKNVHSKREPDLAKVQLLSSEIPTAALVTGVNVPDHAMMFSNLKSMVNDRVTRHIVSLHSTNCQNIKSTIASTVSQLMPNAGRQAEDEEDDDEDNDGALDFRSVRRVAKKMSTNCSVSDVATWYKALYQKSSTVSQLESLPSNDTAQNQDTEAVSKMPANTAKGTPRKHLLSSSTCSPMKCPTSAGPTRSGLRSPMKCPTSPGPTRSGLRSPMKCPTSPGPTRSGLRSPMKCPTSPGPTRSGLRSTTPKKLRMSEDVENGAMPSPVKPDIQSHLVSIASAANADEPLVRQDPTFNRPPIVIILEDFESFNSTVLQDFITICGYHLRELPIVLLFGIATTINVVHKLLPHRVTSLLSMEKFQVPLSSEYLSLVLEQVLLNSDFPFKLGPKVFAFLLDIFLFHNFSVISFIRSYQFAMMDHFYSNPVSILCESKNVALQTVSNLTTSQLAAIRSCASIRRYVNEQPNEEQIKLLKDEKHTKKELTRFLMNLVDYNKHFFTMLSCLHILTCKLPTSPLGKQLRELYATCLTENVFETNGYIQALELLRTLSRDELIRHLTQLVDYFISANIPIEINHVYQKVIEYRSKFETFDELDAVCEEDVEMTESPMLPKKTNIYELRQKLKEMDQKHKHRKTTVYDKLRNETIDFFDSVFKQYLQCPKSFPLYDAMYYDNVAELKRRLFPSQRLAIQTGLSNPYQYLKIESLNVSEGQISPEMPDICIAYKLHLECGRLINLYDWLQAFSSVIHSIDETAFDEEGKPSKIIQARFTRAVAELQFMGFVRKTRRKAEHVERLTWGPC